MIDTPVTWNPATAPSVNPPAPVPAPAPPISATPPIVGGLAPAPAAAPAAPEVPEIPVEWEMLIERSESITKLVIALAKAQKQIGNATKDSSNPHFKSTYASLAAVRDVCRDPLSDAGIAVIQFVTSAGGKQARITTMFALEDEYLTSHLILTAAQATPQNIAAAATYGRRVALSAMAGIAPEDDDGNEASNTIPQGVKQATGPKNPTPANQGPPVRPRSPQAGSTASPPLEGGQDTVTPAASVAPVTSAVPVAPRAPAAAPALHGMPPPIGKPPQRAPGS